MNVCCKQCGKPFPAGQDWCNWCEPERVAPGEVRHQAVVAESAPAADSTSQAANATVQVIEESPILSGLGAVLYVLFKLMVIFVGLVLIAGGGLLGFCGAASHSSGDIILVGFGAIPILIGGFLIYLAFSGKSKAQVAANRQDEPMPPEEAP